MRTRKIIGLAGRAGSGKDTAADALASALGYHKYAFADPLKRAAQIIFGLNHDQVHGGEKEVIDDFWGITPRYILQMMGTEAMRNTFGPDIWIQCAERWMSQHPNRDVVVSDVRFDNEANFIRTMGGTVVHILRPLHGGLTGEARNHVSEKGVAFMQGDLNLANNGSKSIFEAMVISRVGAHV